MSANTNLVKSSGKTKPPRAGMGRPKGVPNKNTKAIKDMILSALNGVGGQAYLEQQAIEQPVAFMGLVGKVIPSEIKAQVEGALTITMKSEFPGASS